MKKLFKNQKGFSHHLLIPIIVVLVIAGIGGYLLYKGHAETPSSAVTPNVSFAHGTCNVPHLTLQLGSHGLCVYFLQETLAQTGYYNRADITNGVFGPATQAAVKHLQADSALSQDGIVGAQTWQAVYFMKYFHFAGGRTPFNALSCVNFTVNGQANYGSSLNRATTYTFGGQVKNIGGYNWGLETINLWGTHIDNQGNWYGPRYDLVKNNPQVHNRVTTGHTATLSVRANLGGLGGPGTYFVVANVGGFITGTNTGDSQPCGYVFSVN